MSRALEDLERFVIERSYVRMSRMQIYSKDLRVRAVAAVGRGIPRREVVETFSISLTT